MSDSIRPWLPWVMAAALVASALGLGKRLGQLPGVAPVLRALLRRSAGLAPSWRSGAIGALTPLLPCGLPFGLLAAALASGSAWDGALVLLGFAAGSLPALGVAQAQRAAWTRLSPAVAGAFQRGLPLLAAAVLVYRAVVTTQTGASCH